MSQIKFNPCLCFFFVQTQLSTYLCCVRACHCFPSVIFDIYQLTRAIDNNPTAMLVTTMMPVSSGTTTGTRKRKRPSKGNIFSRIRGQKFGGGDDM